MDSAIIGAASALLGVLLAEILTWWREHRSDRKAEARIRTMVGVEIEQNITFVRAHLKALTRDYDWQEDAYYEPEGDEVYYLRAWRLMSLPLPPWRSNLWQSQLTDLTTALNRDAIAACHAHYSHLDTIAGAKATLTELLATQRNEHLRIAQLKASGEDVTRPANQYGSHAVEVWNEAEHAMRALLKAGNPLTADTETRKVLGPKLIQNLSLRKSARVK